MKRSLLSCCMIFISALVFGQKQNRATAESFVTESQPAAMIVIPHSPAVVIEALEHFKSTAGAYSKKNPGSYKLLQNTSLIQKNIEQADLLFKVGPNNQEANQSVVYLMLDAETTEGSYNNRSTRLALDQALAYLDKFAVAVDMFAIENRDQLIKQQKLMLAREEMKQSKCEKRCNKLGEKKVWTQQKLVENKKSTIKKNNNLERRLAQRQSTLAYQKIAVEKQRGNLTSLADPKKVQAYNQTYK